MRDIENILGADLDNVLRWCAEADKWAVYIRRIPNGERDANGIQMLAMWARKMAALNALEESQRIAELAKHGAALATEAHK